MSISQMARLCQILTNLWESKKEFQLRFQCEDLFQIQRDLVGNTYSFGNQCRFFLPKPGSSGLRPITRPDQKDVLVLAGLNVLLTEVWDSTFLPSSHGFRPGKGFVTFFQEMENWFSLVCLKKIDVEKCFDRIDQSLLLSRLSLLMESELLLLIQKFLKTKIFDREGREYPPISEGIGITQGSSFSPTLMNIFLHTLDQSIQEFILQEEGNIFYARYADDLIFGFKDKVPKGIKRFDSFLVNTLGKLKLSVKRESVARSRFKERIRILGFLCFLSPKGKICVRVPFQRWKNKFSVDQICSKIRLKGKSDITLESFLSRLFLNIRIYINYAYGCACMNSQRKITQFFLQILRENSKEFLEGERVKKGKGKENLRLICFYEKRILSHIRKVSAAKKAKKENLSS